MKIPKEIVEMTVKYYVSIITQQIGSYYVSIITQQIGSIKINVRKVTTINKKLGLISKCLYIENIITWTHLAQINNHNI